MKRKTTDQERVLFKKHVEQARPFKKIQSPSMPRVGVKPTPLELDGHTAEKLKRGQLVPGARIDLHGLSEAAAHEALLAFLLRARATGARLALVITGTGNPPRHEGAEWARQQHGILKAMVPRWLNEKDFAALHVGFARAHRRHGGDGALYVYLRGGH